MIEQVPGYEILADVLAEAFRQSALGKGRERHANSRPFDRQPIMEIGRMVGPGYNIGQAMKKAQEAMGMVRRHDYGQAVEECLGAIVYLAATVHLIREMDASLSGGASVSVAQRGEIPPEIVSAMEKALGN
jgi:hypothetical protein